MSAKGPLVKLKPTGSAGQQQTLVRISAALCRLFGKRRAHVWLKASWGGWKEEA